MADIPLIDFGLFLKGDEKEKQKAAEDIDDAFRNLGFVYLKNHGVPKEMVEECFAWSKKFFDLPLETKMLAPHPPDASHHRGYSAIGVEKVAGKEVEGLDDEEVNKLPEKPDYKESFESGNKHDTAQPNIWPPSSALPGFRDFMESYFTECASLIHSILSCLSLALAVPEPGLSLTHSESLFQVRLLHYPAISSSALRNGEIGRIHAHSDFCTLTLLFQDKVGGLEIQDPWKEGEWRAAEPIEGTVLVNIGDLLARWSNDRWRSSVHRVGLPPRGTNDRSFNNSMKEVGSEEDNGDAVPDRYSIPVFATANMDTVIEALPGCWSETNPKKYEPVTAWGYMQERMAALYEWK